MNKSQMAAKLAKRAGISQAKAAECLTAIFDSRSGKGIIATELDAGRKITIPGFGTFSRRHRAARAGTNPSTGAAIQIPAKYYPAWNAGKTLKERIAE